MFGLRKHAIAGGALLMLSEVAMLARVEPFWTWHTPIAWTGYILLVDGIVYKQRGSSWLTTTIAASLRFSRSCRFRCGSCSKATTC